jgi:hypothetical protein
MKRILYFALSMVLVLLFSKLTFSQQECEVLLESIKGQYAGGCKKGLAHGEGTSTGTDTYAGKFKKGFPHGQGTYTWESGEFYVGNFIMGKKSGLGKFKLADGTIAKEGIWENDEFKKEQDIKDYRIGMKRNVLNVVIRDRGGEEDKVEIVLVRDGRESTDNIHDLMIVTSGGIEQKSLKSIVYKEVIYPFKANVKFKSVGKFTKSVAGNAQLGIQNKWDATQMPETTVEFEILEKGNWEVRIKY